MELDFSAVPLVDNHCHGFFREQHPANALAWRRAFTESTDPDQSALHVPHTLFYSRLICALAGFLGCEADEEAVLAARAQRDGGDLIRDLLRDAGVDVLLVDQGYPARETVLPDAEVAALAGIRALPMLRLETLMQELIATCDTLDAVEASLRAALADIRAQGYVALKSIAAYRTGLAIARWERDEVEAAFREARREVERAGVVRLAHKSLLDTLLHVAFAAAAEQGVPIQFHTGYGDTDADLRLANPLHLRAVLEDPAYRGLPVVLLHECYPYTREGGYLAAVYGNVYLDLSYGIPFLSLDEMAAFTRAALGVAPTSKLLYSSDGVGLPELHWMSARDGRRIVGRALGEAVSSADLALGEAEAAGRAILRENAVRLYRL